MAYDTRRFNATFTRAESTQFLVLILISLRSTIILSSHLRLGLPKGLSAGVPVKILRELLTTYILATYPLYLNLLDLISLTVLDERYELWSSSFWSLLNSPFSFLLVPNIRLRILFSDSLRLCSSLAVRHLVSLIIKILCCLFVEMLLLELQVYYYSTTDNITVLDILIFIYSLRVTTCKSTAGVTSTYQNTKTIKQPASLGKKFHQHNDTQAPVGLHLE